MDINELMNDEAFAAKIRNAKDLAEVAALFQAQGVDVSEAQLKALLTSEEGELDEAELQDVAGGGIVSAVVKLVKKLITTSRANNYSAGGGGYSSGGGGKGSFGGGGGGGFR